MNEKIVSRNADSKNVTTHNVEERRENGLSLIVIGFLLWFFDALVFFFMPAGVRLGEKRGFAILIVCAFIAGALVMAFGAYLRREDT
jgi:hypothetical protein